jgi:hypothetical protein
LPALVLARHLDGTLDRPAETGRGIRRPGDRYLPCSDRLSPVAEDRPHFYVQTFGRRIRRRADQPIVLAGPGQRVPVDAVAGARALHTRQAGSRLPLTAEEGRS